MRFVEVISSQFTLSIAKYSLTLAINYQFDVVNFIETPCSPAVSSIRLGQSHEIRCSNILY